MKKREKIQQEALDAVLKYKRAGCNVSMGVGKTLVGLKYIKHYQEQSKKKLRVVVVAPKLSILESWKNEAEKFKIDIEDAKFTTYLSLNKLNPSMYDVVVLDECHNLLISHSLFLEQFTGNILGLTGTAPRYEKSEKGMMVRRYCPMVYKYITDDAVDDEILNDYKIIVHRMPLSMSNDILVKLKKDGGKQFYTSEIKNYNYWSRRVEEAQTPKQQQITSIMRMKALMDFKTKEEYAKGLFSRITDKCILFCNTQEQADKLCEHSYHSNNPYSEGNLDLFSNDHITKLSCVLQLSEGVNIPNLKQGIIMHAYGNERKASQRIGRMLRLNPKETSTIHVLCYKDTIDETWVKAALKDFDESKIIYINV